MVRTEDKKCIHAMVTSAITALCKTKLDFKSSVNIEGLLGFTIDKDDIFLVNINEFISNQIEHHEENNNSGGMALQVELPRDVIYTSNGEEERMETHMVKKDDERETVRVSSVIHGGVDTIKSVASAAAFMATRGSIPTDKYTKSTDSQSAGDSPEYQGYECKGEAMVGCSGWGQGGDSPLVAASISQMSGIAQTTQEWFLRENMRISAQLEDQRRKSRDHMRRYRQQLRESNYTEYEERKRRQREGMRRYRERLRLENPEKYAEMNRKHAEQERRRRLRARSLSEGNVKSQPQTPTSMRQAASQSEASSRQKMAAPDFLHMAMETSQLFQARDMHQLLQAGLPVSTNSLAMVSGALGTVGLNPVAVSPNAVTITTATPLALTGVAVEEVHQQQHQQQQQDIQHHNVVYTTEAPQQQVTTSVTTQQQQQMIHEHIQRMGTATPTHQMNIQHAPPQQQTPQQQQAQSAAPQQLPTTSRQSLTPTAERTSTVTLTSLTQVPQTLSSVS